MFRKKKKKQEQEKQKEQQQQPPPAVDDTYDQWIDHTKPTTGQPPQVDDTYDEWVDDGGPPAEDQYDNWINDSTASTNPKVEDEYDTWGTVQEKTKNQPGEDVGDQEYEQVEEEGDIFGFDNKKGSSKYTANSPSWINKPPIVKGTPPSAKKVISTQPPQDGSLEYEDVMGEGDIFGFDDKQRSSTSTTSPSWINKPPPVRGTPPSNRRPISMQRPPDLPKSHIPTERPKSVQSPIYKNVIPSTSGKAQEPEAYEVPQNGSQQQEGESYEEMDNLDLKPTYVNVTSQPTYMNVTSQDVGGDSYEEMDGLDLKKTTPASPTEGTEYYEDVLPDNHIKKPPITTSIAERQQQLQKKETKEAPKKRGLAADYQKMKFEMLAQKFKEIDSGEPKPDSITTTGDKKKATWPPKHSANDEATPIKGTVSSLKRGFQPSDAHKSKDKNMKGPLWHKAPGRNKYYEEHCELEGSNLKLFRNKNDPNPYFTINTTKCEMSAAPEEYEKKNVFKLMAGASRDYFAAFNAGEMKAWMNALRPVVKAAK